jgi:uncharacterized protein YecE (DUF72 family)
MRRMRLGASGWSDSIAPSDGRGHAVFVYFDNDAHRYAAHRARPLRPMVDERC